MARTVLPAAALIPRRRLRRPSGRRCGPRVHHWFLRFATRRLGWLASSQPIRRASRADRHYFDFASSDVLRLLAERRGAKRIALARDAYTYAHLPMVCGIVLFAFAMRAALTHVHSELSTVAVVALCCGSSLYLIAFVALRWRVSRTLGHGRPMAGWHLRCSRPRPSQSRRSRRSRSSLQSGSGCMRTSSSTGVRDARGDDQQPTAPTKPSRTVHDEPGFPGSSLSVICSTL